MTDLKRLYESRVKSLLPPGIETEENIKSSSAEALAKSFFDTYGIDHGQVMNLFNTESPFKAMIEHMYLNQMDMLRDCDIRESGPGLQAQAQLLWELLNVRNQVMEINNAEIET